MDLNFDELHNTFTHMIEILFFSKYVTKLLKIAPIKCLNETLWLADMND